MTSSARRIGNAITRLLIKTSHSLLSAVRVIKTQIIKSYNWWKGVVLGETCAGSVQEAALRYPAQTSAITIYHFIHSDCYT